MDRRNRPIQERKLSQRYKTERRSRSSFGPEDAGDFDDKDEYLQANEKVNNRCLNKGLLNSSVNTVGNVNDSESGRVSDYWKRRQEALESINRKTLIHSN